MNKDLKKTIETYDLIATGYNKRNFSHFWIEELEIFKKLVPGKKIIDLGCGAGRDAEVFTQNGFDYTGIDASRGMLKVAQARVPKATFKKCDFYKLDFPDNSFDGFWASASFLHVPKKDLSKVLKEARRILKPNGIGFISVKEKQDLDEGLVPDSRYGQRIERYFSFFTQSEFKKYLVDAGFTVVKTTEKLEDDGRSVNWLCYFVSV